MPRCPECKKHFRVLEDEDDGQHSCPYCGYGEHPTPEEQEQEEERREQEQEEYEQEIEQERLLLNKKDGE